MSSNETFDNLFGSKDVEIRGTKGQVYTGKIYSKSHLSFDFDKHDIVCITNSRTEGNSYGQHKLIKAFQPESNKQVSDYKEIEQGTHFIVFSIGNVWSTLDEVEEIKNSPDWD